MSERNLYTVHLKERHWWGGRVYLSVIGTGSSKQDDELLIHVEGGGFYSINYNGVRRLEVIPLPHEHEEVT